MANRLCSFLLPRRRYFLRPTSLVITGMWRISRLTYTMERKQKGFNKRHHRNEKQFCECLPPRPHQSVAGYVFACVDVIIPPAMIFCSTQIACSPFLSRRVRLDAIGEDHVNEPGNIFADLTHRVPDDAKRERGRKQKTGFWGKRRMVKLLL